MHFNFKLIDIIVFKLSILPSQEIQRRISLFSSFAAKIFRGRIYYKRLLHR